MNKSLQYLEDYIKSISDEVTEKQSLLKIIVDLDKLIYLLEFKLERAEKVKKTTGILLEETIEELDAKRIAIENVNKALSDSLAELKETQNQLIQSEKMASLGELTAGIAHEIQNPLNFVNNFSEVCTELVNELIEAIESKQLDDAKDIAEDMVQNVEKITYHGKRADGIVKGMLQHSRKNTGERELADVNGLCDEYLRLSYHGLRARDKSFNAKFITQFDENCGKISIVTQDIGRVILNLINNAFYAVNEKKKLIEINQDTATPYEPIVTIATSKIGDQITISIKDNGAGIPQHLIGKIFQPFFTTKPTGSGTGLGLSLAYDIVEAHKGSLQVKSEENIGTEFIITLKEK